MLLLTERLPEHLVGFVAGQFCLGRGLLAQLGGTAGCLRRLVRRSYRRFCLRHYLPRRLRRDRTGIFRERPQANNFRPQRIYLALPSEARIKNKW